MSPGRFSGTIARALIAELEVWGDRMEVALFIPCYVDQLVPSVGLATLRVLEHVGCRVEYDPAQTCCGQPFLTVGARRQAARLARAHLARFSDADAVVCPSASCVTTVRHHYGPLAEALGAGHERLRARTFELGEFLVRKLGRIELGSRFEHRVALLESCHGLRELGLGSPTELVSPGPPDPGPTEQLLRAVSGLELLRPEPRDECCGFGGAFALSHPQISTRMGRDRLRALEATGAEVVTASDVSCLLHLEGIRRREGFGPRPLHLAEILASGLEG